jgi:ADP-ribose pyrophosphatase
MNYTLKKSNVIYKGKVFDLKVDEIEYESGNRGIREIAVHPGGAVIVPVTDKGKIILVTQFRYPFQKELMEVPAGKLDAGEDPVKCAERELEEETGFKTGDIEKLGEIYTAPGYCTEILHIYLARNLTAGNHNREEGELEMQIHELTLEEIEDKITRGEISDGKTICGIYHLKKFLD